jgi:protein-L-isoaspartate(D-aspartate) O-methyltransferase
MAVRHAKALLLLLFLGANCQPKEISAPEFATERERMVQTQVALRGLTDPRLLAAMRKVPREQFVPAALRGRSYSDSPLPIGYEQTISQPFVVAFMTEKLQLKSTDRVLEIGTGSGYQAAILGELAAEVYTMEIIEALGTSAAATLHRLGYKNVHVKVGDGYAGWPEHAPYDAVVVTCAPNQVPRALVEQTRNGGRIVIPVGPAGAQELYVLEKEHGQLKQRTVLPVRFVPMTGEANRPR